MEEVEEVKAGAHRPAKLERLKLVQLPLVEEDAEVLQEWGGRVWLGWHLRGARG